jgi:transposase
MPKASGSHNTASDVRALILQWAERGRKTSEMADLVGCSQRTVQRILKNYQERGHLRDAQRSGRPEKLDGRDLRRLKRVLRSDRRQTLGGLKEIINQSFSCSVSSKTVSKALRKHLGMRSRRARYKPHLTGKHRTARVLWAEEHQKWGFEEWSKVIWTDETSVELGKQSSQVLVWRSPGEEFNEDCLVPTFKSGRQSLMMWSCMAHGKLGPLVFLPCDRRDGKAYVDLIMSGPLWRFYVDLTRERGTVRVMEDGAPIHRSMAAKNFRTANSINILRHPAQSPDLNPIEHVWKQLKVMVNKRPVRPKSLPELQMALLEEWARIDHNLTKKLVESMPNRVACVVQAKGGPTRY